MDGGGGVAVEEEGGDVESMAMAVEVLDCGEVAHVWGVEGAGVEEEGVWFGAGEGGGMWLEGRWRRGSDRWRLCLQGRDGGVRLGGMAIWWWERDLEGGLRFVNLEFL